MLAPAECVLTRAQHNDHIQSDLVEHQRMIQSTNKNHQSRPSKCAVVSLIPINISEFMTGPAAGLLSFGTLIEPTTLPDD